MTDDLLRQEGRRLLLFSVSSDGDLRGWGFNPENVRNNSNDIHVISVVSIPLLFFYRTNNQNSKQIHVVGTKCGKTRASKSRLLLVLAVIGRQSCAIFLTGHKA